MATTREQRDRFASYLAETMVAAGFATPDGKPDVPALVRASGVADSAPRRWLAATHEPTLENLRLVAPALRVTLRELIVASGLMTTVEAGFEDDPKPPAPMRTLEDDIRLDPDLSPERKDVMLQMLAVLREDVAAERTRTGRRGRDSD